jgi:hypothetical protein
VFVSLFATASAVASVTAGALAQEHLDVPIALDFTPVGTPVASHGPEAPADVSFGIYPLSVFGIENAIKRADARADDYASGVERYDVGPIAYSVVAIRDWERRYPSDPWIPKEDSVAFTCTSAPRTRVMPRRMRRIGCGTTIRRARTRAPRRTHSQTTSGRFIPAAS